jgi:NADP-dependent aldehyde dehydrogenase
MIDQKESQPVVHTSYVSPNLIAGRPSALGTNLLTATNPLSRVRIEGSFAEATPAEIDHALQEASDAWKEYRNTSGSVKAALLRAIAAEIEALGDVLIERAVAESGLPQARLQGERGRTCQQLRLFADWVEEGSWVDAVIDEALPERQPLPRPDLRKMNMAIGPVAVFTASNFPLAFSTAGGDTASALAAGCPVIVKAHPSHLGTNAMVGAAIARAVEAQGLPQGIFSYLQGGIETGRVLVQHPLLKAIAFTGSQQGGMALWQAASQRAEPVPVYAEMGSINPVFILNGRLQSAPQKLSKTLAASVNLGAGQFCTNPGLLVLQEGAAAEVFITHLKEAFAAYSASVMLNEGISQHYRYRKAAVLSAGDVQPLSYVPDDADSWTAAPAVACIKAASFMGNPLLHEEVFGPFTLLVLCSSEAEMLEVASGLQGQLTASLMCTEQDAAMVSVLSEVLAHKAGRLVFNAVPTGVEVCPAMHHGGPFPATTQSLFTSVGTDAIRRFARPVCFQGAPEYLLPDELKSGNPLRIWRIVNGKRSQA